MDNADKPAFPVDFDTNQGIDDGYWWEAGCGLTKREDIAKENMAALLSEGGNVEPELEAYAKIAVAGADELLKQLEETQ